MLTLDHITIALSKTLNNARELVEEAKILLDNQRFARAYALAHLATEEMAKIALLINAAIRILDGEKIEWNNLRGLRSHIRKIETGVLWSYFDDFISGEAEASDRFREDAKQVSFYNNMKNWSLYAGCVDGKFVQPSEVILEDIARSRVEFARRRLDRLVEMSFLDPHTTSERLRRVHAVLESIPEGQEALDFLDRESVRAFSLSRLKIYGARLKYTNQAEDETERERKVAEITESKSVSYLLRMLRDQDWYVREAAAWALEGIGQEAVAGLLAALEDDDEEVREIAAWSLGYIGDASAVSGLIRALEDEKLGVRLAAARSLRRFDVPKARNAVESFHKDFRASIPSHVFGSKD